MFKERQLSVEEIKHTLVSGKGGRRRRFFIPPGGFHFLGRGSEEKIVLLS